MKRAIGIFAAIVAAHGLLAGVARAGSCGAFPAPGFDDPDQRRWEGTFSNFEYDYSVVIPQGLVAHASPAPAPLHGFGVVLAWEPRSYIYFDGSGNVLFQSREQAAEFSTAWLHDDGATALWSERRDARLGTLPALVRIVRYRCPDRPERRVAHMVVALSKDEGIVYTAALLTTEDRYAADRAVFERFLSTWHAPAIH